jgi:ABC-type sugar transport system substrate-binding protein
MRFKKYLAVALAATMLLGTSVCTFAEEAAPESEAAAAEEAPASSLPQGDWVIGMANGYFGNTWRAMYVAAFEEKCQEYKDAGIIADYYVESTNADATEQLNQVNDLIKKGCDAICVNAVSASAMMPVITACQKAGVLCVISADAVGIDDSVVEVITDNEALWYIMTYWMAEKLEGKGNIVKITGTPGMPATVIRQTVADNILAEYPDIKVIAEAPGSWSETEAQSAMSTILSTYSDIDAVLTEDVMAEGIMRAYETAGEEIPIMTGDYVMSFFRKWDKEANGQDFCVTTFQPQASADAVAYAVRVLNGMELTYELQPNNMDHECINAILTPPSYCITMNGVSEEDKDKQWATYEGVEYISLAEALEIGADLDDTEDLGKSMSEETWDSFFS